MKKRGIFLISLVLMGVVAGSLVFASCAGAEGPAGPAGPAGAQGAIGPAGPGLEPMTQTFDIYMWEKKAVAEGLLADLLPSTETQADLISEFYHWEPMVLVVHKGDTVVLNVSNPRGTIHNLSIPAIGVDTGPLAIREGKATISFVADRAGSFVYQCTIPWDHTTDPEQCHPDHKYMTGVLLVLDR